MTTPLLLPCPFCGGHADFAKEQGSKLWSVECHGTDVDCVAYIMPAEFTRQVDAAIAWNRRTYTHLKTTHVTATEGGDWLPFDMVSVSAVHSITFEDGSIWDVVNGWRTASPVTPVDPNEEEPDAG